MKVHQIEFSFYAPNIRSALDNNRVSSCRYGNAECESQLTLRWIHMQHEHDTP
jgi:hypothetical protein